MALDYTYDRTNCVKLLQEHLKDDRFRHSLGVEQTAIELARLYGADEKKAGLAGLMHDIAKQMPKEKLDKFKVKYGITGVVERTLHAPIGAVWLRHNGYITDPDVLSAIRYHTTGRPSMTMLEKIIYIADVTEPNRNYQGVDQLRHLARTDLDEAVLAALRMSIEKLLEWESPIDPDTIYAYNDYVRLIDEVEK